LKLPYADLEGDAVARRTNARIVAPAPALIKAIPLVTT
jgi:hypothetical protein